MSSLIERVRFNDLSVTRININLSDTSFDDATLADAMEQNSHIVDVTLMGNSSARGALRNWPRLLRHLEARSILRNVRIAFPKEMSEMSTTEFLQAIQRNTNVRSVGLHLGSRTRPVGPIISYLSATPNITNFCLDTMFSDDTDHADGPTLLAGSLQRLTNLQSLKLGRVQGEYLQPIFASLRSLKSLQTLEVSRIIIFMEDATLDSFRRLLRNTTTLRELVIEHTYSMEEQCKRTLLEIIKSNFSLRAVREKNLARPRWSGFTDEDRRLLRFYANRNERLDQWIENPSAEDDDSIPKKHLRPEILHVAAQAEPSVLFRSLIAVSGDLGAIKRTRKRKRPTYYKPS